jgi:hypothetical protein
MQDPSRVPAYEEGVKIMDQIGAMSQNDVTLTVPVVFEALQSQRLMAQLEAALALHAVALRPDGLALLGPRLDQILALLSQSDSRLKAAAIITVEKMNAPPARVTPALLSFIADQTQPAQVRAGAVGTVVRMTSLTPETAQVITTFLSRVAEPSIRIDALNEIASKPSDNVLQTDIVIQGLKDPNDKVRDAAIHLVQRLGPKAVARASSALMHIAQDSSESPALRTAADRVLNPRQ